MIYEKFEKLSDKKHGRIIKAVIGMSRAKFDFLAEAFAAALLATQQERRTNKAIKQIPSGGPKGSRHDGEEIVFHFVLPENIPHLRYVGLPFRIQRRAFP